MMLLRTAVAVALLAVANAQNSFRIVHINDFHAHVEGLGCDSDPCDGGWPRLFAKAKEFVSSAPSDTLYLDDGDQFMGTTWSTFYKGQEASIFLNELCDEDTANPNRAGFAACVGTLGNHEFDYGYQTVSEYVNNITFPIVVANLVDSCAENEAGTHAAAALGDGIEKYVIVTINGEEVAVTGYLTPETAAISSVPPCVELTDEITALDSVMADLATNHPAVSVILSVGHSGYARDQEIAAGVSELDLLVGGHSHTFLWDNETSPTLASQSSPSIGGEYPTMVGNTPVLQAWYGGAFLGAVDVDFDASGDLTNIVPEITLLASVDSDADDKYEVEADAGIAALVAELGGPLETYKSTIVSETEVFLDGERTTVRFEESNLGNLICDAILDNVDTADFQEEYGNVPLCVINGGGVRASIPVGDISVASVLSVLPFGNTISVISITGERLYLALESALSRVGEEAGEFPQIGSGMRLIYNRTIETECGPAAAKPDCSVASGASVNRVQAVYVNDVLIENSASTSYNLVSNSYIAGGKDGYVAFGESEMIFEYGDVMADAFQAYITDKTIDETVAKTECRIIDVTNPGDCEEYLETETETPSPAASVRASLLVAVPLLAALLR